MIRTCIGCMQTDDHPRHVVALTDGSEVNWHMDCHAAATGCLSCTAQKEGAMHLVGDEFREHVVNLGEEFHQELMARVNPQPEEAN